MQSWWDEKSKLQPTEPKKTKIACESSEAQYCMPALYYLQITGCLLHCHSTSSGDLSVQTSAIYWKHVSHIKVFPSTSNKSSILDTQVYWSHITQSQAEDGCLLNIYIFGMTDFFRNTKWYAFKLVPWSRGDSVAIKVTLIKSAATVRTRRRAVWLMPYFHWLDRNEHNKQSGTAKRTRGFSTMTTAASFNSLRIIINGLMRLWAFQHMNGSPH